MVRREFIKISIPLITIGPSVIFSSNDPILRFGVIADPQYAAKDPAGTRFYKESLLKLDTAVKELNQVELDFVVTLGDVIDEDIQSFSDIMPIYSKLKSPHHIVLGNHDWQVEDKDKAQVMEKLGMAKSYYSQTLSGWRFIYLDGTEVSLYRYAENSPEWIKAKQVFDELVDQQAKQATTWNGGMSSEQMVWLQKELEAAVSNEERVIIFNHYPIMPSGDNHNLWNAEELVKLLSQYNHVALYMNGHNHKGNYAVKEGIHYVNLKGMVETKSETAYAIVSCYGDRIEIEGRGTEPYRSLS